MLLDQRGQKTSAIPSITTHCRALLALLLVKIEAATDAEEDPLPSRDELNRYYVHKITLPYNPSRTESQKLADCQKLEFVHVFPPDLTEDQICERVVKHNDWMSRQIEAASEKVVKKFPCTSRTSYLSKTAEIANMRVRGFYEKAYDRFELPAIEQQRRRDNVMNTLNDAEKKEVAQLIERTSIKVDEDPVLSAHRYFHSPQRFIEDMARSHAM